VGISLPISYFRKLLSLGEVFDSQIIRDRYLSNSSFEISLTSKISLGSPAGSLAAASARSELVLTVMAFFSRSPVKMPVERTTNASIVERTENIPRRGFSPMADYLYMVDLSANEETARNPKFVDRLLVQLRCDDHQKSGLPEADREASACELAVSRYDPENTLFGSRRAKRYDGVLPSSLGHPFIEPCGCNVWRL